MSHRLRATLIGVAAVIGTSAGALGVAYFEAESVVPPATAEPSQSPEPTTQLGTTQPEKVVVTMKRGTNDLHATAMALQLATTLAEKGAEVTAFANLEAVRLFDERQPAALRWGMSSESISDLYAGFIEAGGKVLVCSHCAQAAGLSSDQLRQGATIANADRVADVMLAADKVIDY